jgi:hypothetical protein
MLPSVLQGLLRPAPLRDANAEMALAAAMLADANEADDEHAALIAAEMLLA